MNWGCSDPRVWTCICADEFIESEVNYAMRGENGEAADQVIR